LTTTISAEANPGGKVVDEAFEYFSGKILEHIVQSQGMAKFYSILPY
jgi:microcystin degradation protein MlrC